MRRRDVINEIGIKYQKIGDESYFAQELFQLEELMGYLRNILKDTTKSVFEHVVYDSAGVERTFAEQLEKKRICKGLRQASGLVCTENAKSDHSGDEVRPRWRVN
jgi:hypothetical protein